MTSRSSVAGSDLAATGSLPMTTLHSGFELLPLLWCEDLINLGAIAADLNQLVFLLGKFYLCSAGFVPAWEVADLADSVR